MDIDGFDLMFKQVKNKQKEKERIISEISSQQMLEETLDFLSKNKFHSKLCIDYSKLSTRLQEALTFLIEDLKEYSALSKFNNYSPTQLIKTLDSMSNSIKKLEGNWSSHKIVSGMLELTMKEDPNRIHTSVEIFRQKSKSLLTELESLSSAISKDLIWAYRLEAVNPDKRYLYTMTNESHNRLLFLVSAHLCILANDIGIKSKNGQVHFIHKLFSPIDKHIGRYFTNLGSLKGSSSSLTELFRSKSWVSLFKK